MVSPSLLLWDARVTLPCVVVQTTRDCTGTILTPETTQGLRVICRHALCTGAWVAILSPCSMKYHQLLYLCNTYTEIIIKDISRHTRWKLWRKCQWLSVCCSVLVPSHSIWQWDLFSCAKKTRKKNPFYYIWRVQQRMEIRETCSP